MANLNKELRRALNNFKYERTDDAKLLFPAQKIYVGGVFAHDVNGKDERFDSNLVVDEGLDYILGASMDGATTSKLSTFYVSCYKDPVSPADTWTAANFDSNASEITLSDVTEAARPTWVDANVTTQVISNYASKATFTVEPATLNLWGAALLTTSPFEDTGGVLIAATKFSVIRSLLIDDQFNVGYQLTISSS